MKVHLHLPKTAGTALNFFLQKNFNVFDYGKSHILTENEIKKIKSKRYNILIGHISIKEITGLGIPKSSVFTILRNPIDRCVSWYYYVKNGKKIMNKKLNMQTFFNTPHPEILLNCYNNQTYHIGDYAHVKLRDKDEKKVLENDKKNIYKLYHVFIFEKLDEETQKKFGFILPKKNKTKHYTKKEKIPKKIIDLIIKWNKLDIELYNYIVEKKGMKDLIIK
jgi:hypothetical protein